MSTFSIFDNAIPGALDGIAQEAPPASNPSSPRREIDYMRRARRWANAPSLTLTRESPVIRVPRHSCHMAELSAPMAYVRRRGCHDFLLRYPIYDTDIEGAYIYMFDELLFALPAGRYALELWQGDRPNPSDCSVGQMCGEIEIVLPGPCTIEAGAAHVIALEKPIIRNGDLDVPHPIYDAVNQFSAALCADLEAGDTTIPLKAADKATLCNAVLCRSVELRLCDGLRNELVRFNGCTAGEPTFTRAVDNMGPYRFGKGSTLLFDWTSNNVTAACEGC